MGLSGHGSRLKAKLTWRPPLINAESVGGYLVERATWWLDAARTMKIITRNPVRTCRFYDLNVRPDLINEYRVYAVHKYFPKVSGPASFPAAVYGFAYLRYTEMVAELKCLARRNVDICRLVDAGPASGKKYRIWCVVLGKDLGDWPDKPGVMLVGNPHGSEIQGTDVCMGIIRKAIRRYRRKDPVFLDLIKNVQTRIIPMYNPHGRSADEHGFPGGNRKTHPPKLLPPETDPLRIRDYWNADRSAGIDPNRNFDANWGYSGQQDNPQSEVYPGPRPFAAPETRALAKMALLFRPQISVHYHGPCSFPLYPGWWQDGAPAGDHRLHREVAEEFALRSCPDFANEAPSVSPTPTDKRGEVAIMWFHKEFYGSHLCPEGFYGQIPCDERVIPITNRKAIPELIRQNLDAFVWMAGRIRGAGIVVRVRDEAGRPLRAQVEVEGFMDKHCVPQLTGEKHGVYRRILAPGTYNVKIACPGYAATVFRRVKIGRQTAFALEAVLKKEAGKR